ncbi:MAG: hypothetical protein ABI614_28230, partial [Planctomycetota bacterium]
PIRRSQWLADKSLATHRAHAEVVRKTSRVNCVMDQFGPTDLLAMGGSHDNANSPESKLIGGAVQENKAAARRASPTSYATKDDSPALLIHGSSSSSRIPDR